MNEKEAIAILGIQVEKIDLYVINDHMRAILESISPLNYNKEILLQKLKAGVYLVAKFGNGVYIIWASRIIRCVPSSELAQFKKEFAVMASEITGMSKTEILDDFKPRQPPNLQITPVVGLVY